MMKTSQKLGLAAAVVFVISHCLPAYGDGSGFACFQVCWKMFWGQNSKFLAGSWIYYSGFVISNLLFAVLVAALFVTMKHLKLRAIVSVAFVLHVLSWLLLNACQSPSELHEIKIGYYMWLTAYGLLAVAHLCKEPGESRAMVV